MSVVQWWLRPGAPGAPAPQKYREQCPTSIAREIEWHPAGNQSMERMEEKVRAIQVLLWIGQVLTSLVTLPSRGLQDSPRPVADSKYKEQKRMRGRGRIRLV